MVSEADFLSLASKQSTPSPRPSLYHRRPSDILTYLLCFDLLHRDEMTPCQQIWEEGEDGKERTVLPAGNPEEIINYILRSLLPFLLIASPAVKSFTTKWRGLHSKLNQLNMSLSSITFFSHPLFPTLLPSLLSTLVSLRSISIRCTDSSNSGGKLLLQSDLDIASSSLDLHLHDLQLLLPLLFKPTGSRGGSDLDEANAIVLSHPTPSSSKEDVSLFVRDLFARLVIGDAELKKKALESLLRLLLECGSIAANLFVEEVDINCLIHLLDSNNQSSAIRELAVASIAALASTSEVSRKVIFEEGVLGPLLRLLDSGSTVSREHSADAIATITSDPNNAWAVAAYGGIAVLIDACRSSTGGSTEIRKKASSSLRNVVVASVGGDTKEAMVEEGAIPVLLEMLGDSDTTIQKNSAHCLWILASSGESFRVLILKQGALSKILQLFHSCDNPELMEHVLRPLHVLSSSISAAKTLSGSLVFLSRLADLIGQHHCQHLAASLLFNLSISDDAKRLMAGCMGALVKMMMELPKPAGSHVIAARVLVSLLSIRSNRKELSKDAKSMTRLVQMLNPKSNDGLSKNLPVSVVLALAEDRGGCRKRIVAAGACQHLQKLVELDVSGAKRALQRISGGRFKNLFSSITWRE